MSKKLDIIKKAVFYAHENPTELATILAGNISDVATKVVVSGATSIDLDTTSGSTANYVGKVLSQFGDEMDRSVTLTLKSAVTGVSISSGTVTVVKTVTDGTKFVVKGTCGSVVGELEVTVNVASA